MDNCTINFKYESFGSMKIKLKRVEGGYSIVKCKCVGDSPVIPSEYKGEPIVMIAEGAFIDTDYYNSPDSWNDKMLYLGEYLIAVKRERMGDVYVKPGTRVIADGALRGVWDLTGITIPEGVSRIGSATLAYCKSLGRIEFPSTLREIDDFAITECRNLLSVTFRGSEEAWGRVKIGKVNESLVRAYKYYIG